MEFSRRIQNLGLSPTVEMAELARLRRQEGRSILDLTVGEPDFATPQSIIEACRAALKAGKTRYGPVGGTLALRQKVLDHYHSMNCPVADPAQVVCGFGAKQMILHSLTAIVNPGDEVLIPTPYWGSYPAQVRWAGGIPRCLPPDPSGAPSFTVLEEALTSKTKALMINSPHNPCGYMIQRQQMSDLLTWAAAKGLWVISDEIYQYFEYDRSHVSAGAIASSFPEHLILISGLSKGFAMTGFRVGYAICSPDLQLAKALRTLQSHATTCLPGFVEEAAISALSAGPSLLKNEIQILKKKRDLACHLLLKIPEITFHKPSGALYFFLNLQPWLAQSRFGAKNSLEFSKDLLEKQGVATVPGEGFGAPGYIRISFAVEEQILIDAIRGIQLALKQEMT